MHATSHLTAPINHLSLTGASGWFTKVPAGLSNAGDASENHRETTVSEARCTALNSHAPVTHTTFTWVRGEFAKAAAGRQSVG